jgi:hypothetical protein
MIFVRRIVQSSLSSVHSVVCVSSTGRVNMEVAQVDCFKFQLTALRQRLIQGLKAKYF